MAGTYKTVGRQKLLSFLHGHPDKQYTVDELCRAINPGGEPGSGKSTLYRHLSELCQAGTVRKYRDDRQAAYVYQYVGGGDCCHHFHLKCLSCGELVHLECQVSRELLTHIRTDHGFEVDSGRSILYGFCAACAASNRPAEPAPSDPIYVATPCTHHHHHATETPENQASPRDPINGENKL